MKDFMPARDNFINSTEDRTWKSSNQDVERFIASDTASKMRSFLKSAPDMFEAGDRMTLPVEVDLNSALAARAVLQLALLARETAKNSDTTLSETDLDGYGLFATRASQEIQGFMRDRARMVAETAQLMAEDKDDDAFLKSEMGFTGVLDRDAEIIGIAFDIVVPKGDYAAFLQRMIETNALATEARGLANRWASEWSILGEDETLEDVDEEDSNCLRLICAMGYYEDSDAGIRHALSNLCDYLMTLHMGDMRTVVIDGQELRSIATGIGSLWWSALDAMRIGRLGACEVCGKPFITNNERGKKRKYCSEACKQWRKVHPGETRMNKDKPSPPEWACVDR